MTPTHSGLWALVAACAIWGLSPIYYKALVDVPATELLAHRTIWSLAFFAGLLAVRRRLPELRRALQGPTRGRIAIAALLVTCNWFLFIVAVQIGRTTESSLGYYIFPLVSVVLGVVFLGERLRVAQIASVGLAAVAVVILSVGLAAPPWISLVLATTFGLYALIKKGLSIGPVVSVTAEVVILSPVALAYLVWVHGSGAGGAFGHDLWTSSLLVASGLLTATPMILFSHASQRVTLSTVGLVQYLNPTLQFVCATLLFQEPFGWTHGIAFALIWTALAIYSASSLRQEKARSRAASVAATSGTGVTKSRSEGSAKP